MREQRSTEQIKKEYLELRIRSSRQSAMSIFSDRYIRPVFHLALVLVSLFSIYVAFFGI